MTTSHRSAFVPGHVTGFFSPEWYDDPERTGSVGAGITLSAGVSVSVEPAEDVRVTLNGEAVTMDAVREVLASLGHTARVDAESALPVGTGFGVSGAMALGTALAANDRFNAARSANELIKIAHRAEVVAGTGLGDVVAQARGGIPIRMDPGAPPHGSLDGIPTVTTVEFVSFGELDTPSIIHGDTTDLQSAGRSSLAALVDDPTLATFAETSRQFSRETGLITPSVSDAIAAVSAVGGEAIMAMLGDTVVSLGQGLSEANYDATRCRVHPGGATIDE